MNKFLKNACFAIAIACGCVGVIGSCISTADVLGMKSKKSDNETLCRKISEALVNAVFDVYSRKKDNALEDWFRLYGKTYVQEDIGEFAKLLDDECLKGRIKELFDLTLLQADRSLREQYVLAMSRLVVALYAAVVVYGQPFKMAQDIFAMVDDFLKKFTSRGVNDFDNFIESCSQAGSEAAKFLIYRMENDELACVRDTVNRILGELIEKQRFDCDRQSPLQAFDKDLRGKLLATDSLFKMKVVQAQDSVVRRKESSDKVTATSKKIEHVNNIYLEMKKLSEKAEFIEKKILREKCKFKRSYKLAEDRLKGKSSIRFGSLDNFLSCMKAILTKEGAVSEDIRKQLDDDFIEVFKIWYEVTKEQPVVIVDKDKKFDKPQLYEFADMKSFGGKKSGNVLCVDLGGERTLELCSSDYTVYDEMSKRKKDKNQPISQLRPIDVVQLFAASTGKTPYEIFEILEAFNNVRDEIVFSKTSRKQTQYDNIKKIFGDISLQSITRDAAALDLATYNVSSELDLAAKNELKRLAKNVVKYLTHVASHLFFFQSKEDRNASINNGKVKINAKDLVAYIVSLNRMIDAENFTLLSNDLKMLLFNPNAGTPFQLFSSVNLAFHTEVQMLILSEMLQLGDKWKSLLNPCHSCATLHNVRKKASGNGAFLYACKDDTYLKEIKEILKKDAKDAASAHLKEEVKEYNWEESVCSLVKYDQTDFEEWQGFAKSGQLFLERNVADIAKKVATKHKKHKNKEKNAKKDEVKEEKKTEGNDN